MAKKRKSRKQISEEARRAAENSPTVRLLRELSARGWAEIEDRRKIDPSYR